MKPYTLSRASLLLLFVLFSATLFAQVKIGGKEKENPHPSAVLELSGTDKGFLMPRMTQQQMMAIKDPANALVVYNTDVNAIYIFSTAQNQWLPLLQNSGKLGGDSCEWEFDTTTSRIFLVRGYPLNDSMFYNIATKKFVFSDQTEYYNSQGQNFPVTSFTGKYYFKATASRFTDTTNLDPTAMNIFFEVDSSGQSTFFNGAQIVTVNNPKNRQPVDLLSGLQTTVIHAGQANAGNITGITNSATVNGNGAADALTGIQNTTRISNLSTSDVGIIAGINNNITRSGLATGRVTGDVYGYRSFMSGFNGKVDGKIYGINLGPITGATPKNNYAIYTSNGHNRFGDSTLVTDNFANISPRAVFDVNSTSAMITPAGTTAQRPAAPVTAMMRFNNTNSNMEYYNGTAWKNFGSDSAEWVYDAGTKRVNLVRGLPLGDSVYYNAARKKFVFADKRTFGNTTLPADEQFPGKFIFKGTASHIFNDSNTVNFPSLTLSNFLFEVDNDSFAVANPNTAFYNGVRVSTQLLPTATQKTGTIRTLNLQVNHTGADSVSSVNSVVSNSFIDGHGYTGSFIGYQNNMIVSDSATNNIGSVFGYRNTISMSDVAGGRVIGNVMGFQNNFVGFADSLGNTKINGNAYGVFLNNVNIAAPHRNFAFYSNKGLNRFADSTLITDGFFTTPRAVLDVNSTSAMITPNGSTAQRPVTPIAAMLRFNNTGANMEYYNGTAWKAISGDTAEWKFDAATNRVNLVRGLPIQDTIFYNTKSRQFVFADRNTNTNSLGSDFPVQDFGAKYTFKSTASKRDSTQFDGANVNMVYEIDNTTNSTLYNSLSTSAIMNPKAFQKADQISGITNTTIHAGNDSVQVVIGIINTARNSGNGKAGSITGIQNITRIQSGTGDNAGELVGIRNTLGRTGTTGRVTGNVYGLLSTFTGFAGGVDGNIYGVFVNSVTGAGPRKNFAYYSNKGLNRLGDSTLITDGVSITPRAVLDVNATSSMIVPTGTTAQRPTVATSVAGMVRYNTDNGGRLESYNGTAWSGILSGSVNIDPPNMPANSGATVSFAFTGATSGSVVSLSPSAAPPNGIIIAWARVSAANTIEVRFENNSGAPVNPPSIGYSIRVIQ